LKFGLGVINHILHPTAYQAAIVSINLLCVIIESFDIE